MKKKIIKKYMKKLTGRFENVTVSQNVTFPLYYN